MAFVLVELIEALVTVAETSEAIVVSSAEALGNSVALSGAAASEMLGGSEAVTYATALQGANQMAAADLGFAAAESTTAVGLGALGLGVAITRNISTVGSGQIPQSNIDPKTGENTPVLYDPSKPSVCGGNYNPGFFDPNATQVKNTYWNNFSENKYRSNRADNLRQTFIDKTIKKLKQMVGPVSQRKKKKPKKKKTKKKHIHPSG